MDVAFTLYAIVAAWVTLTALVAFIASATEARAALDAASAVALPTALNVGVTSAAERQHAMTAKAALARSMILCRRQDG